ncbi:hypothetical protein F5Y13DRAFT_183040 [Hypoxylon sp. FL1857]|nr:hypothetical protein F5Y13DRAFT_183040 [Hypoxylon sp. FL1857]
MLPLLAFAIGLVQSPSTVLTDRLYGARLPIATRDLPFFQVQLELGSILSNTSSIVGPSDPMWSNATERYNNLARPHPQVVVSPGSEEDIGKIVKYANENRFEFFVVNRGHALTSTVSQFNGIQIDVRNLRGISISPGKESVRLQAGAFNYEVIEALWKEGYVTTTGSCSCVGIAGLALGGGHGVQQGAHGLISDNVISLDVVLSNGTAITVNETSNVDLWWAMRGAGHNFGIVTSFEMNIYPFTVENYFYRTYEFEGHVLELLFEELNRLLNNGTMATEMAMTFGVYTIVPDISTTEATISWTFVYAGPKAEADPLLSPFDLLDPVSVQEDSVPYTEVSDAVASGLTSELCAPNRTHIIGTAGLQVYNITTQRLIYDSFNKRVAQHPELANTRVVHEGYSVEAVRNGKSDNSAFPLRNDYLLMYFDATPEPGSGLEDFATKWAHEAVDMWNAGQPERLPTTYVNYAAGYESLESMYGYEPWRLERLLSLKARYDPYNRFAYYNPIVP